MKYVVIDLEMCKVAKSARTKAYVWSQETIQIGAVLLDEEYKIVSEFNSYVHPELGKVDSFIQNLTGIEQKDLKEAPRMAEALEKFAAWVPNEEITMVSWSTSDRQQLLHEINGKGIDNPRIVSLCEQWLDAQKMFGQKVDREKNYGLEEALIISDIRQEGWCHDGLTDATNTAVLLAKMLSEPVFTFNKDYADSRDEVTDHLSFSLADAFKNIKF